MQAMGIDFNSSKSPIEIMSVPFDSQQTKW
jgi:hypothetical protein